MASPFRVFRKHQKAMLAVLGLLAMIAFVFLPIVMDQMGTRSTANQVVASTTQFGDVNAIQLSNMVGRRQVLLGFLQRVQYAVQEAGGQGREAATLARRLGEATEESVINTWLLSQEARRLGLAVDDAAINSVLNAITEQRLSGEQIASILHDFRMSQGALFDALQVELLALRLQEMFGISLAGIPPAQQWDYYNRLNRKASIETAALRVDGFAGRVPDPGDAVLREFFNKYKNRFPEPTSPEPGFQVPKRIKLEYVKADYEKFVNAVEISDEEIRKYYEENKENYKREELPGAEREAAKPPEPEAGEATGMEKPASEPPPTAEESSAKPKEEEPDKTTDAPKTPVEPAPEKSPENTDGNASETAVPGEEPVADKPAADESSSAGTPFPVNLVSFQEQTPPTEEETPNSAETKPDESRENQPPEKPAEKPKAETAEEKAPSPSDAPEDSKDNKSSAGETPAEKPEEPAPAMPPAAKDQPPPAEAEAAKAAEAAPGEAPAKAESENQPEPPAPAMPPAEKDKQEPAEVEKAAAKTEPEDTAKDTKTAAKPMYLPLEEVQGEIRRKLERERAREQMQKLLQGLEEKLATYYNQWIVYDATRQEGQQNAKAPVRPDFAKLAEGTPLTAHQTALLPAFEAAVLDIGDSWIGSSPFTEHAYGTSFMLFKPAISQDNDGNSYLFWKTEETEERVPEFEDPGVRQEVLRAWQVIEARNLAVTRAKQLAEEARKSDKSFKEFVTGKGMTVTEAGPFTWLTYGNLPPMYRFQQPPTISSVEGVDMPGHDFMRTVFHLDAGQIGIAMNAPQTHVYLIHAVEFNPLPDVLWTMFLEDPYSRILAATEDRLEMRDDWLEEIKQSVGFQWERQPIRSGPRAF